VLRSSGEVAYSKTMTEVVLGPQSNVGCRICLEAKENLTTVRSEEMQESYLGNLSEFRQSGVTRCVDARTPDTQNSEIPRNIYTIDQRMKT
jgi:hypothetical protein